MNREKKRKSTHFPLRTTRRLSGKERRKPEMTFQEQIKDRLENGFQHWNNGYGEPVEFIASLIESVAGGDFLKKNKGNFC
jgi:hypothetical protein